ncbi:carboxypeptidase-like regulatory domain-containing protein, partial [Pyxidicoccus sp. 3LG]
MLEAAGTVVGTVSAAGGQPAAGARVRLDVIAGPDTGTPARLTLADAQGRFRFEGVPAGQVVLAAAHERLGAVRLGSQPVGPRQQVSAVFTLQAPASVEGRVVGGDGKPVAGVPVVALAREHGVLPVVTLSGADGRYRLSPLGEGLHRVMPGPGG